MDSTGTSQAVAIRASPMSESGRECSEEERSANSSPPHAAPLEKLPAELRRQDLPTLDLEGLRALVHASPIYHQQYLLDRKYILCSSIQETLGSATADACVVYRSAVHDFGEERELLTFIPFLEAYHGRRLARRYSISAEGLTEDAVVDIASFFLSTVKPLFRYYADWALNNLGAEAGLDEEGSRALNRTEDTRLVRALYRFQLCCNLIGRARHGTDPQIQRAMSVTSDYLKCLHGFLDQLEPWEAEETITIYDFAREKLNQAFSSIGPGVAGELARFFEDGALKEILQWGTASHGLRLLRAVLFEIKGEAALAAAAQRYVTNPVSLGFLSWPLLRFSQIRRHRWRPSRRDVMSDRRRPLPFRGDGHNADGPTPPLAWTLIWRGTCSNLVGDFVPAAIRRWAYVMWDAERLERSGGEVLLARQWEAEHRGRDPRDTMAPPFHFGV